MTDALAFAFAFSLGVHLVVLLSLGLVVTASENVRAYRRFVAAVALWLLLALLAAWGAAPPVTGLLAGALAHWLAVLLYLAGGLPHEVPRSGRIALIVVAVLLLPFTVHASPWYHRGIEIAWYVGSWSLVALALRRSLADDGGIAPASVRLRRRRVAVGVLVAASAAVGVLVAFGALVAVPLLAAGIQAVVLYAAVRLSLYQVRAGASRSGALAAELAEHDRRAVAGEIAAMVAHEVRNPLTGVRSLAQRLANDTIADERRRQYAELIVREVDRVDRMVAALQGDSARGAPPQEGETRIALLLDDLGVLTSDRARRSGVALVMESTMLVAAAPREPLAQVLLNLLLNALSQAPTGSTVRLEARSAANMVELLVRDSGPGIPAAERETIFQPFQSGTGGTGLGLAVVRRICEARGWPLRIEDTPGGGATFVLSVPHAASSATLAPDATRAVVRA